MLSSTGLQRILGHGAARLIQVGVLLVAAASALAASAHADSGLVVAPSLVEVSAPTAGSGVQELIVINSSAGSRTITVDVAPYKDASADYSGTDWLRVSPSSFELGPSERRAVAVRIDVPEEVVGGGRYASVVIRAQQGDMLVDESIVPFLIVVGAPQQLTEDASLERASVLVDRDGRTSFRASLLNKGNRHIVSRHGEVTITREDGSLAGRLPIEQSTLVVPGTSETVTAQGFMRWQEGARYRLLAIVDFAAASPAVMETSFTARSGLSLTRLGIVETTSPSVELELWNDGTLGAEPQITIEFRNSDGGVVSTMQPRRSPLWPDKRMQVVAPVPGQLAPGSYTVQARVEYGAGLTLDRSFRFQVGSPSETSARPVRLTRTPDPASQRFALGLLIVFVLVVFGSRVPAVAGIWRRSMRAMGDLRAD